ncbi:hypothetical protein DIS24_g11492 [Lasiodiplodia hormozganensis]|uniref:Uncharacterized protein n=1 Tax=Lasiodiplodia hormozganensis TaxID=869390 RepID=A0AA39WT98_9PEZI|nr:hypothetical protein DIS24_g11492 [Lasiodiplodia hormozganensis]
MPDRRPHQPQFTGNNPPAANDDWSHSILADRFDYQHGRLTNVNNGRGATATHGPNEPTRGNPPHPMPVQYPLSNTSTHHPGGAQRFPHGHGHGQQPHDAIALNPPPPVMPRLPAAAAAGPGPAQQQQQPSPCGEATIFPCCNKHYKSEFARRRHQRESPACPYWTGEILSFLCPFCATQPKRRAALVQHVQERHKQTNREAKDLVHAWYNRDGSVRGL